MGVRRRVEGFGDFLFGKRQKHSISQEWVARAIGISAKTVSEYERNDYVFSQEHLQILAEGLEGEEAQEWLQKGGYASGGPSVVPIETGDHVEIREATRPYVPVPSDASLPVGGMLRAASMVDGQEQPGEVFPCLQEHAAQADYVVRVEGWSMHPELKPGDYIAVKKAATAHVGDIVVARQGDETFIKRLSGRRGRHVRLTSDNPEYDAVEGEDIHIIGVVAWQHRPAGAIRAGKP